MDDEEEEFNLSVNESNIIPMAPIPIEHDIILDNLNDGETRYVTFNNNFDLTPSLHMSGEIIIMDGNVVIDGEDITINGNLKINGNLNLNGTLQTHSSIINTNKSTEIMFFDLTVKNGIAYIHDKVVTNPSEIGLYILQKSNEIGTDHIKSIEDI